MRQCLNKAKTEVTEKEPPGPEITKEHHKAALATARVPMFTSKSSGIPVVMPEGVESIDPAKYHAFLGVKEGEGEKVAMASMDAPAQPPQGSAAAKATHIPATDATTVGDTIAGCDLTHL